MSPVEKRDLYTAGRDPLWPRSDGDRYESRSPRQDDQVPAARPSSHRPPGILLTVATVLLLSTGCGLGKQTVASTPTSVEPAPTPTSTTEPTATPTPSREDPYEPNDSIMQAYGPLMPAQEYRAYITAKDDLDLYYFEIESPQTVEITLQELPAGTDYDLYLVTGEEDTLASSCSSGEAEERIEYTTSSVGVFYILVLPFHNFSEVEPYALQLRFSPAPTPSGSDSYEPNDTFGEAEGPVAFDLPYQSYVWDEGDIDIYLLEVDRSGIVTVDLTNIPKVADLDLFLYDEAGEALASSTTVLGHEHIEQRLEPGTYYVTVRSFAGFSRNEPYTLQLALAGP